MKSFFKIFFASLLALFIFTLLLFFVLLIIVGVAASPSKPNIGTGVLVLDLSNTFNEQEKQNPIGALTGDASADVPGLYDVVRMLHYAKSDSSIKGLFIKAEENPNGYATSEELIQAIDDFKSSGKTVVAYGETMSQKAYYVA
ncbi:MAG: signal peptide peptidase SppA, partial [Bacteroidota bacterium]|nr:signal peptide peptidase SppA [Bacteroidota bacterium]